MSWPHFYLADRSIQSSVTGLTPVKAKHQTYADIYTPLGAVLRWAKRQQVNMVLRHIPGITQTEGLDPDTTLYLPLLWMHLGMSIEGPMLDALRDAVQPLLDNSPNVAYALAAIGALLLIIWIGNMCQEKRRSVREQRIAFNS